MTSGLLLALLAAPAAAFEPSQALELAEQWKRSASYSPSAAYDCLWEFAHHRLASRTYSGGSETDHRPPRDANVFVEGRSYPREPMDRLGDAVRGAKHGFYVAQPRETLFIATPEEPELDACYLVPVPKGPHQCVTTGMGPSGVGSVWEAGTYETTRMRRITVAPERVPAGDREAAGTIHAEIAFKLKNVPQQVEEMKKMGRTEQEAEEAWMQLRSACNPGS